MPARGKVFFPAVGIARRMHVREPRVPHGSDTPAHTGRSLGAVLRRRRRRSLPDPAARRDAGTGSVIHRLGNRCRTRGGRGLHPRRARAVHVPRGRPEPGNVPSLGGRRDLRVRAPALVLAPARVLHPGGRLRYLRHVLPVTRARVRRRVVRPRWRLDGVRIHMGELACGGGGELRDVDVAPASELRCLHDTDLAAAE
jgi:hypothetical protein